MRIRFDEHAGCTKTTAAENHKKFNGRRDSLVIFGEEGDSPLLGSTTLKGFGLILDPFRRELRPLPMVLQ
jgi:hypothetical protein